MKITKFLVAAFILILFFGPAQAEEKENSAMRYTTMGQKRENVNLKNIEYSKESPLEHKNNEAQEATSDQAWERYKALAAGKTEPQSKPPVTPETAEITAPVAPQPTETKQTGLAGLIQQYQENKEKRGGMRSMTVTKPGAIKQNSLKKSEQ